MKSIRRAEHAFDARAEKFIWKHLFLGFLALFVGMPVFILVCVLHKYGCAYISGRVVVWMAVIFSCS